MQCAWPLPLPDTVFPAFLPIRADFQSLHHERMFMFLRVRQLFQVLAQFVQGLRLVRVDIRVGILLLLLIFLPEAGNVRQWVRGNPLSE